MQGQLDVPLSEVGLGQARAVARALAGEAFSAVYSSDLARVRQTCEPLAGKLGASVVLDPRLRERHYGVFQGLTYADAKIKIPEGYARFRAKELDYAFENGESLLQFNERCLGFFEELRTRHPGASVLVFTHGGVLEMLYRHATGRGLATPRDFEFPNAAVNRVEHGAQGWTVLQWADIGHLSMALDDLPD